MTLSAALACRTGSKCNPVDGATETAWDAASPAGTSLPPGTDPSTLPEPDAWILEDSHRPWFDNLVFTRGFTYFVEWGDARGPFTDAEQQELRTRYATEVGYALRNALTMWGSAMLLAEREIPTSVADYLEGSMDKQGGNRVYRAPQVVQVNNRKNATLVIRLYYDPPSNEPGKEHDSPVAQAQMRGRTILLNTAYRFVFKPSLFTAYEADGAVNLTAVIGHELGHCFGLGHAPTGKQSIMVDSMPEPEPTRVPGRYDGKELGQVLTHPITGAKPGVFTFAECAGLHVPGGALEK